MSIILIDYDNPRISCFANHSQKKCTNKHRFGRVAWKGQFLVNKPIGKNYCCNAGERYSHYQDRY